MLDSNAWKKNEPRLHFPIFAGMESYVDITIQQPLKVTLKKFLAPLYYLLKKQKTFLAVLRDYYILIANPPYRFKAIFVDHKGNQLISEVFHENYSAGDYFNLNVTKWLASHNCQSKDGVFILIANHGRPDLFGSSPGNATLTVLNRKVVAGYRTGFFSRPLNDGKKHYGFTGLNPQVQIDKISIASLLLINHSSNPLYNQFVNPKVRLYRNPKEYIEADFGEIPPHSFREKTILELFPDCELFLESTNGQGYSITKLKGATLASIHILRSRNGDLLSMEHSRPSHPNVINYF